MREVPKRSRAAVAVFVFLGLFLVGGPALLAWTFFRLLLEVVLSRQEMIGTSFFFLGILCPFLALCAFLGAEVLIVIRLVHWQKRVSEMAHSDAKKLRQLLLDQES